MSNKVGNKNHITSGKKLYIAREEVLKLLMNHIGDFAVDDLGWWLETKTSNSFTVIEREVILKVLFTFDDVVNNIAKQVASLKEELVDKLSTLKR